MADPNVPELVILDVDEHNQYRIPRTTTAEPNRGTHQKCFLINAKLYLYISYISNEWHNHLFYSYLFLNSVLKSIFQSQFYSRGTKNFPFCQIITPFFSRRKKEKRRPVKSGIYQG